MATSASSVWTHCSVRTFPLPFESTKTCHVNTRWPKSQFSKQVRLFCHVDWTKVNIQLVTDFIKTKPDALDYKIKQARKIIRLRESHFTNLHANSSPSFLSLRYCNLKRPLSLSLSVSLSTSVKKSQKLHSLAMALLLSYTSTITPSFTVTSSSSSSSKKPLHFLSIKTPKRQHFPTTPKTTTTAPSPPRVAAPPSVPTASEGSLQEDESDQDYRVDDEFAEESTDSKFSWRDHWYPVSLVEDLDQKMPTAFQLLGRDLVLWFDQNNKEWVAFDDKCPHRLAPLSVSCLC